MSEFMEDLQQRYPEMKPISSAPTMFSVNGIGTACYGEADYDRASGTYVKTLCLTFVFIPIFALSAYRVLKDPNGDGWYFLGKVPLKAWQRLWNLFLVLLIAGGIGGGLLYQHTQSPEYKAGQKLAQANNLRDSGKQGEAARLYGELISSGTPSATPALNNLKELIDSPTLPPSEAPTVYQIVLDQIRMGRLSIPDLSERALKYVEGVSESSPSEALALLELAKRSTKDPQKIIEMQQKLLEKLVANEPENVYFASELSEIYESTGQQAKCEKLLAPHANKLGTREAAAVLGRIYGSKNRYEEAAKLLRPFVDARLGELLNAKRSYDSERSRVIASLSNGTAPGFDFNAYDKAAKPQQIQMGNEYIDAEMEKQPALKQAMESMRKSQKIVQAALDLGIVLLQWGQAVKDPEQRKALLTEAEKRFLSVREFAGKTDDYLLSLGQVYYWLGKHKEGKQQFDKLLETKNNEPKMMILVGRMLRDVGETNEARMMIEQAYNTATDAQVKYQAAGFRAVLRKDIDDELEWYAKCDPTDKEVQAGFAQARGNKALGENNQAEAIREFKNAIQTYDTMRETPAVLNNSALVHFELFTLSSDTADFQRGTEKLDRAIALQPSDSILLSNGASTVLDASLQSLIGSSMDLKSLKQRASFQMINFTCKTPAERDVWREKLKTHPGVVKARNYMEKAVLLAPKNPSGYYFLMELYRNLDDVSAMTALADRAKTVEFDLTLSQTKYQEFLQGTNDAKLIADAQKGMSRVRESIKELKSRGDATLAFAVSQQMEVCFLLLSLGQPIDAQELLQNAEDAEKRSPSLGSARTVRNARMLRGLVRLKSAPGPFAKLAKEYYRSSGSDLIDLALFRNGDMAKQILADADLRYWLEKLRDIVKATPFDSDEMTWGTLVNFDPAAAAAFAAQLEKNPMHPQVDRLMERLQQSTVHSTLKKFFAMKLKKKDQEAEALLDKARKEGLPIPKI
jgi:tetratricopeptide (TPR) repeat protein